METATREVALFSEATLLIVWSGLLVAFARITTHGGQRALETIAPLRVLLDAPDALLVANARVAIALALIEAGDLDGAEREATLVLEYVFVPHMPWMALGALALVALRRGEHGRALALAERGLAVTTKCFRWSTTTDSTLHLVRARALQALGRKEDAHAAIREAYGRILGIAATLDPDDRSSYLTNIDANAQTLTLAREWLGEPLLPAP